MFDFRYQVKCGLTPTLNAEVSTYFDKLPYIPTSALSSSCERIAHEPAINLKSVNATLRLCAKLLWCSRCHLIPLPAVWQLMNVAAALYILQHSVFFKTQNPTNIT